ncbi:MAG: hypothetical protein RIR70_1187, partial [Pseudomonadota bacterium]
PQQTGMNLEGQQGLRQHRAGEAAQQQGNDFFLHGAERAGEGVSS